DGDLGAVERERVGPSVRHPLVLLVGRTQAGDGLREAGLGGEFGAGVFGAVKRGLAVAARRRRHADQQRRQQQRGPQDQQQGRTAFAPFHRTLPTCAPKPCPVRTGITMSGKPTRVRHAGSRWMRTARGSPLVACQSSRQAGGLPNAAAARYSNVPPRRFVSSTCWIGCAFATGFSVYGW